MCKAFKEFNTSVGAPMEIIDEDFGHKDTGPHVVKWCVCVLSLFTSTDRATGWPMKRRQSFSGKNRWKAEVGKGIEKEILLKGRDCRFDERK